MIRFIPTSLVVVALLIGCSQPHDDVGNQPEETSDRAKANLLFVQEARGIAFDGDTLTMNGVKPLTLFFTDRPERIAGYWTMDEFVKEVSTGPDSFAEDPPNATLVSLEGDEFVDVVLVLVEKPRHENGVLVYPKVRVIGGDPPATGGAAALFIDTIGRPMSPGSVAGVHRRHRRREVSRHAR